ncbi:coiled-coil domain-containing protein 12 [Mugil cephalus]|uniref:coiled-coil domain-containing protein 12 n=1 Tax=Mugil cephalus TaxID=48193 RepID=UPI001FB60FA2|nr:coiled-coil domain-containing protein 12 [Mugil cephalus]
MQGRVDCRSCSQIFPLRLGSIFNTSRFELSHGSVDHLEDGHSEARGSCITMAMAYIHSFLTRAEHCDHQQAGQNTVRIERRAEMERNVGSLQEQALKRKERLKALRDKQIHGREQEDGEPENKKATLEETSEAKHRELKLRNYTPEDEELKERQVPKAKPASVEDKVKDQLEAANPEPIIEEVDLANLAPRKPDWDLKRDVAKKLEKLERRTQRAIAELIRDRLRGSEEELAGAVGAVGADEGDSD